MALELRPGRDGKLRGTWYGRYEVGGRRRVVNLGVRVAGTPPASGSLRDLGDLAFERSRERARAKLEQIIEESRQGRDAAHLVERIYEIRTGERIRSVRLENLAAEWAKIPRRRPPDARYAEQCAALLARFARFARERDPKVEEIAQVSRQIARAFMDAEAARGITAKTWNDTLKLLRATLKHLLPAGGVNPFSGLPTREVETVFRKPFNPDELRAILDAAQDDEFIRPILVVAMCTAMRRGDCCLLRWSEVDLPRRFITVKTAKTGATVAIPIFPMLHDELARIPARTGAGHVFPAQAAMYKANPDGITYRVRKVFAAAGFKDPSETDENGAPAALAEVGALRGEIHAPRNGGVRRASVRDFHSFRVTWVTLALTAGVPLELVQRVTGHKTVDVVLKHYFQPGREEFRLALQSAMPKLLTNGAKTPKDQMLEILDATATETWRKDAARLRALVETL